MPGQESRYRVSVKPMRVLEDEICGMTENSSRNSAIAANDVQAIARYCSPGKEATFCTLYGPINLVGAIFGNRKNTARISPKSPIKSALYRLRFAQSPNRRFDEQALYFPQTQQPARPSSLSHLPTSRCKSPDVARSHSTYRTEW